MFPATHSVALPSTTHQEYVVSTTMNIVDTVSKIAKEAGEMLKGVPYVKAFAGIIIQIITIREVRERKLETVIASHSPDAQEIQMAKDRSQELIDKILRRSKVILDGLLRVTNSSNMEQLKDIEGRLNDYNKYGAQSCSLYLLSTNLPSAVSLPRLS
jgi:hypothetical protein